MQRSSSSIPLTYATERMATNLIPALLTHGHDVVTFVRSLQKLESFLLVSVYCQIAVVQRFTTNPIAIKREIRCRSRCCRHYCRISSVVSLGTNWLACDISRSSECHAGSRIIKKEAAESMVLSWNGSAELFWICIDALELVIMVKIAFSPHTSRLFILYKTLATEILNNPRTLARETAVFPYISSTARTWIFSNISHQIRSTGLCFAQTLWSPSPQKSLCPPQCHMPNWS